MNSYERVQATMEGRPTDRRAIAPVLSLYGARLTNCKLSEYYTDPAAYARGQAAVYDVFRPDILFAPVALALFGASFGSQLRFFAEQPPNIGRPAIKSIDLWDNVNLPDFDVDPGLNYIREAVRLLRAQNPHVPIAALLVAPTDLPALVMGMERWLDAVLFETSRARKVVEEITPFFVQWANQLMEIGVTLNIVQCVFALPAIVTRNIATSFALPALFAACRQLRGPLVVHHMGGEILPVLDLLKDLPDAVAYALGSKESLRDARSIVGPEPVLLCGPNGPTLYHLTAAQVEAECHVILEDRRADPRFILYTSAADIPLSTPVENIHALRKAAEWAAKAQP